MVHVKLFAQARDLAGCAGVTLDQPIFNVAQLRQQLSLAVPKLADLIARSAIAVNGTYANDDTAIEPGDEIALIPPVSGG